jgi:hypothetical protein
VRDREVLEFWTALGRRACGLPAAGEFTEAHRLLLDSPPAPPPDAVQLVGAQTLRPRKVWQAAWQALRPRGWSRALHLDLEGGTTLFLPMYRGFTAVLPQGFAERTPPVERAWALVGRGAAAWSCGFRLWICAASVPEPALGILSAGRVSLCTVDRLGEVE